MALLLFMCIFLVSFLTVFFCSWAFIRFFPWFSSSVRAYMPDSHHKYKHQVSIAGGICIILGVLCAIAWVPWYIEIGLVLSVLLFFGGLGFLDDYYKVIRGHGISERTKSGAQLVGALFFVIIGGKLHILDPTVYIPLIDINLSVGWILYAFWVVLVITAGSNAVNLTDGLDGLVAHVLLVNYAFFIGVSLTLQVSPLIFVLLALCGGLCAFLWFNAYPATLFMGDAGSLSLGAALAAVSLILKAELLLPITGVVFVIETLSVIVQVGSYRLFRRRIFKMAPFHHHLELSGWPETKIVTRAFVISVVMATMAFLYVVFG